MFNLFNQSQRFSIRKYAIGVASVMVATAFLFGSQSALADEITREPKAIMKELPSASSVLLEQPVTAQEPSLTDKAVTLDESKLVPKEESVQPAIEPELIELSTEDPKEPEKVLEAPISLSQKPETREIKPELTHDRPQAKSASGVERAAETRSSVYATRSADSLPSSGTYYFSATAGIKAEPKSTSPDLASYSAGQSVNYDRVLETDGHQWISYIAYSGNRRYIAIKPLPKPAPVASPVTVPISSSLPGYTLTLPSLAKEGISIFSISSQVTDRSRLSYAVWSDEGGQDDLKWYQADSAGRATIPYENHKNYGLYHIHTYSSESGLPTKLAERTISLPKPSISSTITKVNATTVDITVSNVPFYVHSLKIPVWSDAGGQDDIQWYSAVKQNDTTYKVTVTSTNHKNDTGAYQAHVYGQSSLEGNRLVGLGVTAGFTIAAAQPTSTFNPFDLFTNLLKPSTPSATALPASGTYTFTSRVSVKNEPKLSAPEQAFYNAGQSVNYDSKLEADGYNWISYVNFRGSRSYIAVSPITAGTSTSTVTPSKPTPNPVSTATPSGLTSPNARPAYQANTYPVGECTWGAKQAANWVNNNWGNAKDWIASAQRDGFVVGDTPVVGAVAVWPNTGRYGNVLYGHVGVVTEVASNGHIRVLESNLNGKRYLADHQGLFHPTNPYTGGVVKYIYPPSR